MSSSPLARSLLARVGRVQTSSAALVDRKGAAAARTAPTDLLGHNEEDEDDEAVDDRDDVAKQRLVPTEARTAAAESGGERSGDGSAAAAAAGEQLAPTGSSATTETPGIAPTPRPAPPLTPRVWTAKERRRVVAAAAFAAFLHPLATSIYTPALPVIKEDLQCTDAELMITISAYLIVLGFMPLVWGPVSDVYGRRRTILISSAIFCATSVACGFSWNIGSLIAMRVLQAFGSSACLTVGAGAIADTHEPQRRGAAMGLYLLGPLVGPVLGPAVGGILTQYLGWRSIFYLLAGMAVLVVISVYLFLPETLAPLPPGTKKRFPNPLAAFLLLRYAGVVTAVVTASWAYGCFYAMVVAMPQIYTYTYGLEPSIIGAIMIPSGFGTMMGSVLGGYAADFSARGGKPTAYRLIPTSVGQLMFVPGIILLGWLLRTHLAVAIILYAYSSFFFTFPRPGLTTYTVELASQRTGKQVAGSINGLLYSCMYLTGGISSQVSANLVPILDYGWFFTAIALPMVPMVGAVLLVMWRSIRDHWHATHAPHSVEEGAPDIVLADMAAPDGEKSRDHDEVPNGVDLAGKDDPDDDHDDDGDTLLLATGRVAEARPVHGRS